MKSKKLKNRKELVGKYQGYNIEKNSLLVTLKIRNEKVKLEMDSKQLYNKLDELKIGEKIGIMKLVISGETLYYLRKGIK